MACLFLHDPENILHLLGNLVFLAAVGPLVESEVGPTRFTVLYLASGLLGVASHWVVAVASGVGSPLIGASSAIAGCVGYCCVRFARRRVPLAPRLQVNVWIVALVWIGLQALGAFVKFGSSGGSSYVSHIGGFVGGVALAFVFRAQRAVREEVGRERLAEGEGRSPAAALEAAEEFLRRHPGDRDALWKKAAALHAMGERQMETEVLVLLVRAGDDVEKALDCLAVIDRLRDLSSTERMRLAAELQAPLRTDLLASVANGPDTDPERPYALVALAEEATDDRRATLLAELVSKYEFHAATELARSKGLVQ